LFNFKLTLATTCIAATRRNVAWICTPYRESYWNWKFFIIEASKGTKFSCTLHIHHKCYTIVTVEPIGKDSTHTHNEVSSFVDIIISIVLQYLCDF